MPQAKHKYRVSVYLGKENYTTIKSMSDFLGISVSAMTKIFLDTGMSLAKQMEAQSNGKQ